MLNMNNLKIGCEPRMRVARVLTLFFLLGSMVLAPMNLPLVSKTAEAGCFVQADSQCDLIGQIEITWDGIRSDSFFIYTVHFTNLESTLWNGICGAGAVDPASVSPCGTVMSLSKRTFSVAICPQFIDVTSTVGYVIRAYIGDQNTPRKWHDTVNITPGDYVVGQTHTFPCG